ncbi:MFS transporter [Bradyrhizobium elkanii]|uniref:MFS transporter n=1 Tax=Bradyrhizobium elkanii TaxID=29448 RepID=UPI00351291FD
MTAPEATSDASAKPEPKPAATSWRDSLAVYLQPRVLIVLLLGFSSGLPLALSGSTLQVWMKEAGVDLGTIGLLALIGTPYTLKFLWAPLVDALHVPLFTQMFGRRRGWLLFSQLLLIAAILVLAMADPARSPWFAAFAALLVATASSTQDIVVDAFRVESLPESEQAAGMASYVAAYRVGMLVSTAGALFIVSGFESAGLARPSAWMWGYVVMAVLVVIGIITALAATDAGAIEGRGDGHARAERGRTRVARRARRVLRVPQPQGRLRRARLCGAVQVHRRVFRHHDRAVRDRHRLFQGRLRGDREGRWPCRNPDRRLCRRLRGAALFARDQPLDRRRAAGGREPVVLLARPCRRRSMGARACDHRGEFHQRDRHRDLRRLFVGTVPQPAAHRDPIRAADGARGGRPHLSVVGRGLCRQGRRLASVLRDLRAGRDPEPDPARLAAAARAFRRAGAGQGLARLSSGRAREPELSPRRPGESQDP